LIGSRQFQTVQGALARQRRVQLALACQQSQQRIVTQLLVIVEILVPQRQSVNALRYHLGYRVPDAQQVAPVEKAHGKAAQQPDAPVHLAQ
jgi:hypothetical protein